MLRTLAIVMLAAAALTLASPAAAQSNPFSDCKKTEPVRLLSQTPEPISGRPGAIRWTLTGSPVIIVCDDTIFQADLIVYEDDTKLIHASGNVNLIQDNMTLSAERAEMDGKTKLGTFYDAAGIARVGDEAPKEKSQFGTVEPDVSFYGETIEKLGPKKYKLHHGGFSTCAQPTPRWEMTLGDGTITVDEHALMRNVILKVKDVPLLYLPAFYYPMDKEGRSTGFLLPTYGSQSFRGTTLSNAFFWAISRSQDATFFHDWTSKSGQGFGTEYRYVQSPGANGRLNYYMFDTPPVLSDGGEAVGDARRSIRVDGNMNQGLPHRFRLLGQVNYFTDVATQQVYQNVYDTSQQRSFGATLTGNLGKFRLATTADQQESFYGGSGQRNGRLPSADISFADQSIGKSKVYVGASANTSYLVRQSNIDSETSPVIDQSLMRLDGGPHIRAPLGSLSFLSATADASWRLTYWSESLDNGNPDAAPVQVPVGLSRQLFQGRISVTGPTFSRIFQTPGNGYADRFKHVIEPRFSISRTSSFADFNRVVKLDYSVDGQVGGVTQIDYGIDNKILARRTAPPGPPGTPTRPGVTRQVVAVSIYQSYYSNSQAALYDSQYQLGSSVPGTFSPLAIRTTVSPSEAVSGDFSMEIDAKVKAIRTLAASSRLNFANLQVTANWSKRQVVPELPGFEVGSHFLGSETTIRSRTNTLGGGYRFDYDFGNRSWVQQRVMAYYNSQCCGISFDWQKQSTPLYTNRGYPTNTSFGISFTLAGIGSFSNPLGSFGGGR